MNRSLFKKILIAYIILAPLLLFSLEIYLSREIKQNYLNNLKENLLIQARLVQEKIPEPFSGNLDDFCKKIKKLTGARVTLIGPDGKVIGDSDEPSENMENHANRPEIKEASLSGIGSSIRFSQTLKQEQFYLAVSINDENKSFLRLSMPLNEIKKSVNKIRYRIISVSLLISFIALMVGLIQTRKVTKTIEDIADFSKDVAEGNFKRRLFLNTKDELGQLGINISKMAEELHKRLKQSEDEKKKIEAIIHNISDGLVLTDLKGIIIMHNKSILEIFDINTTIEGKTLLEAFRKVELMEMVDKVLKKKDRISNELTISNHKEISLIVTASPFHSFEDSGELSGIVFTLHDITRLKKLEEIRKDFVANVSHEIKTPITAIKGFAETLLDGAIEDKENARKFLETIKENSERLNFLVNDLLTLSAIELGDITIRKKDVYLEEVANHVIETLSEKANSKGLYLKKEIYSDIKTVKADRDRLIQILMNLVDNGIKFTNSGGVIIKTQNLKHKAQDIKPETQKDVNETIDKIEIIVEDTGIGIPQKFLPRLGERFFRVDKARSRELGGTGLGLAIVKHLVKAHDWEMRIESVEGQGTKVHIIIPILENWGSGLES